MKKIINRYIENCKTRKEGVTEAYVHPQKPVTVLTLVDAYRQKKTAQAGK